MSKQPSYFGHRKRLRKRFLEGGLDGFLDYEVVELLLTLGTPRKDCKPLAKQLVKKFKTLRGVLEASPEELQQVKGVGPNNIFGIRLFQALLTRYFKEKIIFGEVIDSPQKVAEFFHLKLGGKAKESFWVLSLDSRNRLLKMSEISVGTVNVSLVHPREVFREAIQVSAVSLILVHNHPSGDPDPSEEDLEITKKLVEAGKIMGIEVLDHIIIAKDNFFSFRQKGMLN